VRAIIVCRPAANVNSSSTSLTQCTGTIPSGNVQDFSSTFNAGSTDNGNIASWTATGAQALNRAYTYDHLNRLQTMSSTGDPSGCTGYSWTYDAWGNRTAQTGTSGTNCNQASTGYNTKNQITSPTGYQYDANGNLTNDAVHTYTYDAENRLVSVDGGATAS